jgi:hypothetical protein
MWGVQKELQLKLRDVGFTLCNSSKNRNENLEKVIPLWRMLPFSHCVIVDWNSKEPVWENLSHLMDDRFTVIRVEDQHYYWSSIIHNICIGFADTEWVLRIDSDVFGLPRTINEFEFSEDMFCVGGRPRNGSGTDGTVLFKKEWWERTGGYDERQTGYGYEDVHFYQRMEDLGVQKTPFCNQCLIHMHHSDSDRVEYRDINSIIISSQAQGNLDYKEWNRYSKKFPFNVYKVHGKVL